MRDKDLNGYLILILFMLKKKKSLIAAHGLYNNLVQKHLF